MTKIILDNEALKPITTLSLLVGRFAKMQQHDITQSDAPIMDFEIKDWGKDRPYRQSLEPLAESYPIVQEYINEMDRILGEQDKYRRESGLETMTEWKVRNL